MKCKKMRQSLSQRKLERGNAIDFISNNKSIRYKRVLQSLNKRKMEGNDISKVIPINESI